MMFMEDKRYSIRLRRYITNRKVAVSNPDEITSILNLPNPSSRTMALDFTQPLVEMSIRSYVGRQSWAEV
jgi:hypothetical protein